MMHQAELPLHNLSIVRNAEGNVVISSWGIVVFVIPAFTLEDVRRGLRKRCLDPGHIEQLIYAVAAAGVVEPDPTPAPF